MNFCKKPNRRIKRKLFEKANNNNRSNNNKEQSNNNLWGNIQKGAVELAAFER